MQDTGGFKKTLKRVRDTCYEAVEVSGICSIEPVILKGFMEENDLFCCAIHENLVDLKRDYQHIVAKLKILECNLVVVSFPGNEYMSREGIRLLSEELDEIGKKLKDYGIKLGYHNHALEFEKFQNRIILEELFSNTNPEYICAEIDIYWVQYGGGDPVYWINKVAGRVPVIHFKDMTIRNKPETQTITMAEVGEGNLNWQGIIDVCEKSNVRWYIVEQDRCERDPFESIEISYNNMKKNGNTVGKLTPL